MSLSQYIIICRGRTDYGTQTDHGAKVRALSAAAADLVAHVDITNPGRLTEADVKPISDLQHLLMDQGAALSAAELDVRAVEMFNLLDALEERFDRSPPRHQGYNGPLG